MAEGRNINSLGNLLKVALGVCLVCSIVVSCAAVLLKPMQEANRALDRKQNVLWAAGVLSQGQTRSADGRSVDELFNAFEVRLVDLDSGRYVPEVDAAAYAPLRAAKDPQTSRALTAAQDLALIGRRENMAPVYVRRSEAGIDKLVLPVRGYGLWGTLHGYLALERQFRSVAGLAFHTHKETPGLGGEVDNPDWKAQWSGVVLFDAEDAPAVRLAQVRSPAHSPAAQHEVDALSGATLTSRGVQNLVNFWVGELGFGPYLRRLEELEPDIGAS